MGIAACVQSGLRRVTPADPGVCTTGFKESLIRLRLWRGPSPKCRLLWPLHVLPAEDAVASPAATRQEVPRQQIYVDDSHVDLGAGYSRMRSLTGQLLQPVNPLTGVPPLCL